MKQRKTEKAPVSTAPANQQSVGVKVADTGVPEVLRPILPDTKSPLSSRKE
jgi:hypothetical protein